MQITVLGAGAGGTAVAFDCASHGHDVRLFDFEQFPENIAKIAEQGGIHADGDIAGFGPISYSGHDIDDAEDPPLVGVELLLGRGHVPGEGVGGQGRCAQEHHRECEEPGSEHQ